jgi:hypothetical protein
MELKDNGYAGQSNGVFTIFLKKDSIPRDFEIIINKLKNNSPSKYSQFSAARKYG